MDILDDSDWMMNQLLRNRCGNPCKHKENRFNRIVWFNDKAIAGAVRPRSRHWTLTVGSNISIVYYEEVVISLSLNILKCGKKRGTTEGVFHQGKAPSCENPTNTNLFYFTKSILPHVFVTALCDIARTESYL